MKVMVISQPKAGTYLCSNLLVEMQIPTCGYHYKSNLVNKYDLNDIENIREGLKSEKIRSPLTETIKMLPDNYHAVSHLDYNQINVNALKDFKIILLTRDYAERVKSWQSWTKAKGNTKGASNINYKKQEQKKDWIKEPNVFHLQFDDMIHKNKEKLDQLQEFLFNEVKFSSVDCMSNALQKNSLTKSKQRS